MEFLQEHFLALRTDFSNEVDLLTQIEHKSLVKILGFVNTSTEKIVITEYVPNGTLREHLDGEIYLLIYWSSLHLLSNKILF